MTLLEHRMGVIGASFSANGQWILTVSADETRLWPVDPMKRARKIAPRDLTARERERYGLVQKNDS